MYLFKTIPDSTLIHFGQIGGDDDRDEGGKKYFECGGDPLKIALVRQENPQRSNENEGCQYVLKDWNAIK